MIETWKLLVIGTPDASIIWLPDLSVSVPRCFPGNLSSERMSLWAEKLWAVVLHSWLSVGGEEGQAQLAPSSRVSDGSAAWARGHPRTHTTHLSTSLKEHSSILCHPGSQSEYIRMHLSTTLFQYHRTSVWLTKVHYVNVTKKSKLWSSFLLPQHLDFGLQAFRILRE